MCFSHLSEISVTSLWRILRNDQGLHPCKIKLSKNWSRLTTISVVCSWIGLSNNLKMIWIFIAKSSAAMRLISGWMASSMNKICIIGQTAIHTYSMTHNFMVWCGLWAGGVIGPYFFRDDQDRHVTVNGNRYRSLMMIWIGWYGLGGHVFPTGRRHKPHSECHNQFIGNQVWRRLSHEMVQSVGRLGRAIDYFLWGYVKSMVYANKPATMDELRTNIEHEIAAVLADLCLKIVKNCVQLLDFCKRARAGHAK